MHLFQKGDFTLASGAKSTWKIECDALTEDDWEGLAEMLASKVVPFGKVFGVPRGGIPFANALSKYIDPNSFDILIVDDVWTTGGSMKKFIKETFSVWTYEPVIYHAVVFARNPPPPEVFALFTMGV